ncbi:MAG: hypothetical protein DMF58_14735 [Acidobacteria bacterium]|nr:MAG: hypothetical protein DMF58_14735 [Acidobacteriota bacterium]
MRAIRLIRHGAPLIAQDIADPWPQSGEVLIEIRAAGICHSDAHYRAEAGRIPLPRTLGHEIAGTNAISGERVAIHYLLPNGDMIGKEVDGGFAEKIVVPAANLIPIPDHISFEEAAIMMCSTATAYHALRLANFQPGESVAILGFGGLGISALQLARRLGASEIRVVDRVPEKLAIARDLGAIVGHSGAVPNPGVRHGAAVPYNRAEIPRDRELLRNAVDNTNLACTEPSRQLQGRNSEAAEAEDDDRFAGLKVCQPQRVIRGRLELMQMRLDLSRAITRSVPLESDAINAVLDDLDRGTAHLRTVIIV